MQTKTKKPQQRGKRNNRLADSQRVRHSEKNGVSPVSKTKRSVRNNRIDYPVTQSDVIKLIHGLPFEAVSVVNRNVNEKILLENLIRLNQVLKTKNGYFDRDWNGDETLSNVIGHLSKNVQRIYGKEISIMCSNESDDDTMKFAIKYVYETLSYGTHISAKRVADLKESNPEAFLMLASSLAYMINRFGIPTWNESYFFTATMEMQSELLLGNEHGMSKSEVKSSLRDLKEWNTEGKKFLSVLNSLKPTKDKLVHILLTFEQRDPEIKKFIDMTLELVCDETSSTLLDFIFHGHQQDEISFMEGMTVYWKDDWITDSAFDHLNESINNDGIAEPVIVIDLLKDQDVKVPKESIVNKIKSWMEQFNLITYDRD
jgi:hypothetical protein